MKLNVGSRGRTFHSILGNLFVAWSENREGEISESRLFCAGDSGRQIQSQTFKVFIHAALLSDIP